jgi:hypothetical protein
LDAIDARYAVGFQIQSQNKIFTDVFVARLFRGGGLDVASSKSPPLKRRATADTYIPRARAIHKPSAA